MTADDSNLSHKERQLGEIRSDIESTREKLAQTLDAIEDKLNVPKQAQAVLGRGRDVLDRTLKDNPVAVYAAAGGVALVTAGLVVWRIVRR
ncbi:DUF3618 domain-containing protein [Naasia sp. SYSU D00057]|jgi:hypothetical protein|uniref:DUF3618 domain-containing protein n=1 Tax=Naasia sp. SYSU D00057 TaxID=2817380 RepID=UPI001FEDB206|nr:DUF3618 domain-containing protein [Naasia sp. SYSU D00057]